jgi:hypothetical protein
MVIRSFEVFVFGDKKIKRLHYFLINRKYLNLKGAVTMVKYGR